VLRKLRCGVLPLEPVFCHVCGALREPLTEPSWRWTQCFEIDSLRQKTGPQPGLAAAISSRPVRALWGAILSGVIYRADTMLEWQAVQTWRIEWMLASAVALLAALLLKKPAA